MADTNFSLSSPGDSDDLPRTLRRERERQKAERQGMSGSPGLSSSSVAGYHAGMTDDFVPAAVKRFEVPFLHLVMFYLKAVLAAIPAMILLGVLVWSAMELLQRFYPELIQTKIIICSPSNPKCS